MKHFLIGKIDPAKYRFLKFEEPYGGSRPRLLLQHADTRQKFILKTYSHNAREVWAELCATKLGELLQLDIQKVSIKHITGILKRHFTETQILPLDWEPIGALVRHAFPKGEMIRYGKIIVEADNEVLKLNQIETKIRSKYYAPNDILDCFSKMVVFDAFIGNMDRHHENWGIIEDPIFASGQTAIDPKTLQERRHFATLFDHGSSLLFELDEASVKRYLANPNTFKTSYISGRAYTFFVDHEGNPDNIFSIIKWYIENDGTGWGRRFKKAIRDMFILSDSGIILPDYEIAKVLIKMPSDYYNEERKQLLLHSLSIRKQILTDLL